MDEGGQWRMEVVARPSFVIYCRGARGRAHRSGTHHRKGAGHSRACLFLRYGPVGGAFLGGSLLKCWGRVLCVHVNSQSESCQLADANLLPALSGWIPVKQRGALPKHCNIHLGVSEKFGFPLPDLQPDVKSLASQGYQTQDDRNLCSVAL